MNLGEPTVGWPTDPTKLYMYMMYREWFWGPYDDAEAVLAAAARMDSRDPYWDYQEAVTVVEGDTTPRDDQAITKLRAHPEILRVRPAKPWPGAST